MNQPRRRKRLYATLGLLGAVGLAGCEGANLFQATIVTGEDGPKPTITTPEDGATVGLNSSLGVGFDIDAPDGAASYTASTRYVGDDTEAWQSVSEDFVNNVNVVSAFTTLSPAAGQVTGEVYVIVELTDIDGDTGRDSVKVTITN